MILFFDTETTGLPVNYKAPVTDLANWPRLIQLAYLVYDNQGNRLHSAKHLIKPEGFTIPVEASKVHGITTEKATQQGQPLEFVLNEFFTHINSAKLLVAHNMDFDEKITGAEFLRKNLPNPIPTKKRLCTQLASTNYCNIPGNYGKPKWPKLSELHIKLFGVDFEGAHDALADIIATANCFWELEKRNVIRL